MKKKLKIALLPLACLAAAGAAQAQNPETGDTLQFRAGVGVERDSNVLRAPTKVSDEVGTLSVGARYDKQISLQRIVLDVEAATYKHRDLDSLDYSTVNYNAAWNFAVTPRFRGVVSADRRQYRDITNATTGVNESTLRTERTELAQGTYTTGMGWLGQIGASHRQSDVDSSRALEASPRVNSVLLGVGRETPSGSSAILQYRHGTGEYQNLAAGIDFKENEISLIGRYPVSPRTSVQATIGHLKREHDNAPQRDFSGAVASLRADWAITAKTSLAAGYARELGSYEFASGGSINGNRYFIEPLWRATEKISVRLRLARETRDWDVAAGSPDAGRADRLTYSSAAVEWEPRRNLFINTGLRNERRSSNLAGFDFSATILSLGGRFVF